MPKKKSKAKHRDSSDIVENLAPNASNSKKEQAKRSRKSAIKRNRRYIEAYKIDHPCECGESEPCCLSFHHYEGNKEGNISDMVNRGYGLQRMKNEIDKCVVMCLNCHAKLHKKEKDNITELLTDKEKAEDVY